MLDTIKYLGFMKTWLSDVSIPTCAITEKQMNITKESNTLGIQRRNLLE